MWRSAVGNTTKDITRPQVEGNDDDDWETDADFVVSFLLLFHQINFSYIW